MKKVLLIAQNEAKAEEGTKVLSELGIAHIKRVYPGAKRYPRTLDAVVVFFTDASEANLCEDVIKRYAEAPIKVFLGSSEHAFAKKYKAESFKLADPKAAVAHMHKTYADLEDVMRKVFQSLDKDGNGQIDVQELKQLSKELSGRAMDQAEIEECMIDLDVNKDNKITFDEFKRWWLSGKQGLSRWMRRFLAWKLKTIKFLDAISGGVKEALEESKSDPTATELQTSNVSVNINKFEHAGMMLSAKLMVFSNPLKEELLRLRAIHNFKQENHFFVELAFTVKDTTVSEAVTKIDSFLTPLPSETRALFNVIQDGGRVAIGFVSAIPLQGTEPLDPILNQFQEEMKVDQDIEVILRTAVTP